MQKGRVRELKSGCLFHGSILRSCLGSKIWDFFLWSGILPFLPDVNHVIIPETHKHPDFICLLFYLIMNLEKVRMRVGLNINAMESKVLSLSYIWVIIVLLSTMMDRILRALIVLYIYVVVELKSTSPGVLTTLNTSSLFWKKSVVFRINIFSVETPSLF